MMRSGGPNCQSLVNFGRGGASIGILPRSLFNPVLDGLYLLIGQPAFAFKPPYPGSGSQGGI